MANTIAYVALFSWPLVVLVLFRRLPLPSALVWSILGGYLFLPPSVGINLPALPTVDKTLIPSVSAAVMCLLAGRDGPRRGRPRAPRGDAVATTTVPMRAIVLGCLALMFAGIVLTVQTNGERLFFGPRVITDLGPYDAASIALSTAIMLAPFLLARRHLSTREAHVSMLKAFAFAGLAYSLLCLVEIRLSPQLNNWIYGFHAHSFGQQKRFGGFRPTVFIVHGLRVAIFMAMALLAAAVLWRTRRIWLPSPDDTTEGGRRRTASMPGKNLWGLAVAWLFVVLVLCKSIGAIAIALLLLPIVLLTPPRVQILASAGLAAVVLTYPMLRGADVIPTQTLVGWAEAVDERRAGSLQFRLANEDVLLARANEKALAGWGTWARNLIFDERTGRQASTPDGVWVIIMGQFGWIGYVARFGLLTLPVVLLAFRGRADGVSAGLSVVLVANLIDLVPNSGLNPVTWMIAGALSAYRPEAATDARARGRTRSRAPDMAGAGRPVPAQ